MEKKPHVNREVLKRNKELKTKAIKDNEIIKKDESKNTRISE